MKTNYLTTNFIIKQIQSYPKLQVQDLLKALHQSVFGCGHFVSDKALDFLYEELSSINHTSDPDIESLDGDYSRIYLSQIQNRKISAETLFKLFVMSSQKPCGDISVLEEKLSVLLELAGSDKVPFTYKEVKSAVEQWKNNNYTACRHSEIYRKAYVPAYRVIHNNYVKWLPVFSAIDHILENSNRVLVAIEGGSASGKSTLSELLSEIYDCNVFHMDDFFLRPEQRTKERFETPGGNIDSERFLEQVLIPLSEGKNILYSRFDCSTQSLQAPIEITGKKLNIIEGAYSMHPSLSKYYDLSIFLNINKQLQEERIHIRNSESMQKRFFNEWIPMEEKYFSATNILQRCSLIMEVN